jgi:hypothetical protein
VINNLATLSQVQGEYETARYLYKESLALKREIGDMRGITYSLDGLGNVALEQGDYATGRSLHEENLALRRSLGDRAGIVASIAGLAGVLAGQATAEVAEEARLGAASHAARLLGAVEAHLEAIGASLDSGDRILFERNKESLRTQLGEAEFDAARTEGQAMSIEEAIELALRDTRTSGGRP